MNRGGMRSALIAAACVFALSACAGAGADAKEGDTGQFSGGNWPVLTYESPNLTDHGDSVTIIFPEQMFAGVELSDEFVEVNGYIAATRKIDGRVSIVMSKERQALFLSAFRGDVDYNIEYFLSEIDYLKGVAYSDDLRYMDIYVDGKTDKGVLFEIPYFFSGPFEQYQYMLGQEIRSTMNVIDAESKQTIFTLVFPDDDPQY